jgi:hypothetical protein
MPAASHRGRRHPRPVIQALLAHLARYTAWTRNGRQRVGRVSGDQPRDRGCDRASPQSGGDRVGPVRAGGEHPAAGPLHGCPGSEDSYRAAARRPPDHHRAGCSRAAQHHALPPPPARPRTRRRRPQLPRRRRPGRRRPELSKPWSSPPCAGKPPTLSPPSKKLSPTSPTTFRPSVSSANRTTSCGSPPLS